MGHRQPQDLQALEEQSQETTLQHDHRAVASAQQHLALTATTDCLMLKTDTQDLQATTATLQQDLQAQLLHRQNAKHTHLPTAIVRSAQVQNT